MKKIPNPHDRYFRSSMQDLQVAADFFRAHLPGFLIKKIKLETLTLKNDSFIDKRLTQYWVDILYGIQLNAGEGYIYLLAEHQSAPERFMAFRLLNYTVKIMEQHIKKESTLPVVFPLVFYNGACAYRQPRDLFKLFGSEEQLARQIMFKPFCLVDLTSVSDEVLRARKWSGIMGLAMKHIKNREMRTFLCELFELLGESYTQKEEYVVRTLNYIYECADLESHEEFARMIADTFSNDAGEKIMTLKERAIREGLEQGMQQGMQQGIQQGIELGARKARRESQLAIARKLIAENLAVEFVASVTELPLAQVQVLMRQYRADTLV